MGVNIVDTVPFAFQSACFLVHHTRFIISGICDDGIVYHS